jgi:hypothetical protein
MKRVCIALVFGLALNTVACDDAEKKAAEVAAAASASAKVVADKVAAEASAKVAEAAAKELGDKKTGFKADIEKAVKLMDQKATALKEKAAKLPAPAKVKADAAFAAYEKAKAGVNELVTAAEGAKDLGGITALVSKLGPAKDAATKALDEVEAVVSPAKK